jgi:hypothetical protein
MNPGYLYVKTWPNAAEVILGGRSSTLGGHEGIRENPQLAAALLRSEKKNWNHLQNAP